MRPSVSIVIPAFNERDRMEVPLGKLIEHARTTNGTELIVVDDGSSDGTGEMAEALLSASPD